MIINWYSKLFNSVCASMSSFFLLSLARVDDVFCFLTFRSSKLSRRKKI